MIIIAMIISIIIHKRPRTIASSFSQYTIEQKIVILIGFSL
jgi:hypothetical protein